MYGYANYNDFGIANLMAVINRLTALYRRTKFFDKTLFGIIVSGNSGSGRWQQLIGALSINKASVCPHFAIMAANNPGYKGSAGMKKRQGFLPKTCCGRLKRDRGRIQSPLPEAGG